MKNSILTKTLFSQVVDLTNDVITLDKRFNAYDIYNVRNSSIRIYHYPVYSEYDSNMNRNVIADNFVVNEMIYTFNGCTSGTQANYGSFDNIQDAIDCALGVIESGEDEFSNCE